MSGSTFTTLNIADSSLNAAMMSMNVASNNISNAQTPGYAQETVAQTNNPSIQTFTDQYTYMGQGVDAESAQRQTDEYINQQYRSDNSQYQYWNSMNTELTNVESIFSDSTSSTSDTSNSGQTSSIQSAMDSFFSDWNQLSQNPNNEGVQSTVLESSQNLVNTFSTVNTTLNNEVGVYNNEVSQGVNEVNTIATNIAQLNSQIQSSQQTGSTVDSLEDQRDNLLNQLSNYMNINVSYTPDPTNNNVTDMTVTYNTVDPTTGAVTANTLINNSTANSLTTSDVQNFQSNQSGTLSAYNKMASYTTNVANQMNGLLVNIANSVNQLQSTGYGADGQTTGMNLFNVSGNTVTVNPNMTPGDLASASQPNSETDGSNALAIANLSNQNNYDATYAGYVAQIGDDTQGADNEQQTYNNLTQQVQNTQTSISGVDINQEMSNIIEDQQTYEASSQLVSVFNQMINSMIQNS